MSSAVSFEGLQCALSYDVQEKAEMRKEKKRLCNIIE